MAYVRRLACIGLALFVIGAAPFGAHASRQIDGQEWPELGLPESETALIKALRGKTVMDADALSVFFALLPFGYYAVEGPAAEDLKSAVLQHDILYGAPAVEYRLDLSSWTDAEVLEHRETMRYAIHTDPNFSEAGVNGHARARLDVENERGNQALTLKLSWLGQYHTKLRLTLNAKGTRVESLEVTGPVSERPGFRPPPDKATAPRTFRFTNQRPIPFIDTDCDALLARLVRA